MMQELSQLWSKSQERRISWVWLGPLFLMLALNVFVAKYSWPMASLGFLACLSFPFVWKWPGRGVFYSGGLAALATLWIYVFSSSSYTLSWMLVWGLTLAASLLVASLCGKEAYAQEEQELLERENKWNELQELHTREQGRLTKELEYAGTQLQLLKQKNTKQEEDLAAFEKLITACQEEADKYFARGECLSIELAELQNCLARHEEEAFRERLYAKKNKELLKKLNEARVERYQYKLLAEQGQGEKPPSEEMSAYAQEQLQQKLQQLEGERASLQKAYQGYFREYKGLSQKIQMFFSLGTELTEEVEASYHTLRESFEEKGRQLQQMRIEIFKIEGHILQVKKELKLAPHDAEASPGSYLAIADQECLRLEEENTLLLQLLSQQMPLLSKKADL